MFLSYMEEEYLDKFITAHSSHGYDHSAVPDGSPHKLWFGGPNQLVTLPLNNTFQILASKQMKNKMKLLRVIPLHPEKTLVERAIPSA